MSVMPVRTVVGAFAEPGWDYGVMRSPYSRFHIANGAKYCVYNNRLMPVSQRGDRFDDYWTLRQRAGLFDTGERPIEIAGPDAERLCNRLFTRGCSTLKPGRAAYGLLCYPDGGVLCDGILMRLAQDRFWYVQADGPVYSWLIAHAQGMDVAVRDPNSWVAQVQGPLSLRVLERACDDDPPEGFGYFAVARVTMGGMPVIVSRTGWTGEVGFEFYTLPDEAGYDPERLWRHILNAGAEVGMPVCALDSMDIRRIEAGILNNISDMDHTMNPFQAGLGAFVRFDDREFIGREALLGADRGLLLHGLKCPAAEPLIGGQIRGGGEIAGRVTAAAWSPLQRCGVAIVRLRDAGLAGRSDIEVAGRDGAFHAADLVELPMYDKDKRIPRGLDTAVPSGPMPC